MRVAFASHQDVAPRRRGHLLQLVEGSHASRIADGRRPFAVRTRAFRALSSGHLVRRRRIVGSPCCIPCAVSNREKGWIWPWFSPKIAEVAASAKAIVMHKVTPRTFTEVTLQWNVSHPAPPIVVDCSQSCYQWGWQRARIPCEAEPTLPESRGFRGFDTVWNGSLCPVDPMQAFSCCFLRASGSFEFNATHDRELSLKLLHGHGTSTRRHAARRRKGARRELQRGRRPGS